MKTEISFRDPHDLRLHKLQSHLPDPDKTSPEWLSFVEGLMLAGPEGIPPLVVTREGLIMDGGRRWRAAKQLQWENVPCIERPESEAASLIVESLLGQRNLPRGTKVYLTIGLMPEFVKSAESRRIQNIGRGIKNGQKPLLFPNKCDTSSGTVNDFCARLGVHPDTYFRAVRVADLFAKHPHFREQYEADLLSGEKSLWNIESAIKGALTDQSPRTPAPATVGQLELFTESIATLGKASKYWAKMDDDKKDTVRATWGRALRAMPADLREELATIINEIN